MEVKDGTPIPFLCGIIWYSDGTKREFVTPSGFEKLPSSGVILIQLLYGKSYKGKWVQEILCGSDYYFEYRGEYYNRQAKHIPQEVPESQIKEGAEIERADFVRMYNEACEGVLVGE